MSAAPPAAMPFIVLSDSTLQYLLWMDGSGKSYGVETPFPTDHGPLIALLKKYYYSDVYVRLIPLRQSLNPNKQGAYDWLADVRDQYGLAADDLTDQTIMSLQGNDPDLVDQLYTSKDCHFRPSIAAKAIGLLLGRARAAMRCMLRPSYARQLQEIGSIAIRHSHKPWVLRRFLEPGAMDRPMPRTAFQTYIHDDMPGPRDIFKQRLPEFQRTFCNDEALFTTLTLHAGEHGAHLCTNLKQPAHRADIFRYIYHYTHGGLYIDIKFGFKVNFDYLMEIM
ncbi:unnamed protein product, partial [Symbiodinium sp. KB8]